MKKFDYNSIKAELGFENLSIMGIKSKERRHEVILVYKDPNKFQQGISFIIGKDDVININMRERLKELIYNIIKIDTYLLKKIMFEEIGQSVEYDIVDIQDIKEILLYKLITNYEQLTYKAYTILEEIRDLKKSESFLSNNINLRDDKIIFIDDTKNIALEVDYNFNIIDMYSVNQFDKVELASDSLLVLESILKEKKEGKKSFEIPIY